MQLSEAIRRRIINLADERNITLHKLSLEAGIPYSTLSSFINGKSQSPKPNTGNRSLTPMRKNQRSRI